MKKKTLAITLFAFFICAVMLSPLATAEICPNCGGSGDCDECGGDGWNVIFPCDYCDGTGVCPSCDGTGEIIGGSEIAICVSIMVIIVIIIIIVIYLVARGKKKETIIIRETLPYPQQYQQSPLPQTSPCSTCRQPLRYVQAYQRWYCDTCRKYV